MVLTKASTNLPGIISDLDGWKRAHKPYDRIVSLAWFRFTAGVGKKGVLRRIEKRAGMPKRLFLNQHALDQLFARLGYPKELYEALPNKLNAQNLNYLMKHKAPTRMFRLRIIDRNHVRAVLSDRFRPFDNIKLLRMLEPYLAGIQIIWPFKDEMILHMSVLSPKQIQTNVGGIVQQGIHISNSEVGVRSVTIAGHVYRQAYQDSLIDIKVHRCPHVGSLKMLQRKIKAAIDAAQADAAKIIDKFSVAASKDVNQPKAFIRKVLREEDLSLKLVVGVFDALPTHMRSRTNQFEVGQAFARAANKFDGEAAYRLRQAAVHALDV